MESLSAAGRRVGTTALQIANADWGRALKATTRTIAALAIAAFVAGEQLGRWVHQTSALLGQMYACLLVGHQKAAAALNQIDAATDAYVEAAVADVIDLAGLTVRELRTLALALGIKKAGGRRTCSATKASLIAALA